MQYIGKIDKEKYKLITEDITTDEVILTDKQVEHIKERHPNDYEQYFKYISEIVENPDYIIRDTKPNTGFLLKEFSDDDKRFQLILRLHTSGDNEGYKNSIITFLKVSEKKYNQYLRNKEIVWKKLDKNAIIKVQYKRLFEVVKFVATTRRWYRQGKPERCRREPRLPNNQN